MRYSPSMRAGSAAPASIGYDLSDDWGRGTSLALSSGLHLNELVHSERYGWTHDCWSISCVPSSLLLPGRGTDGRATAFRLTGYVPVTVILWGVSLPQPRVPHISPSFGEMWDLTNADVRVRVVPE